MFKHELKQNKKILFIYTMVVTLLLVVVILVFPALKQQMNSVDAVFSNLGDLSKMFGLDQLSMQTLIGYYGIEAGNILGLGGGLFAGMIAINSVSKEEDGHTAEFLFSHPISRLAVMIQKLIAIIIQLIVFDVVIIVFTLLSASLIGETLNLTQYWLFHMASFVTQIQIALLCFCGSAFLKHNSIGLGIAIPMVFYFISLISKITNQLDVLKYFTPFTYSDPALIISSNSIDVTLIFAQLLVSIICVGVGVTVYIHKDLAS